MGSRPGGTKTRNGNVFFYSQRRGHDLAINSTNGLRRKRALTAIDETSNDTVFTLRCVDGKPVAILDCANFLGNFRALIEQTQKLDVDRVDLHSKLSEVTHEGFSSVRTL